MLNLEYPENMLPGLLTAEASEKVIEKKLLLALRMRRDQYADGMMGCLIQEDIEDVVSLDDAGVSDKRGVLLFMEDGSRFRIIIEREEYR